MTPKFGPDDGPKSRAEILAAIRHPQKYSKSTTDPHARFLLESGVMPFAVLLEISPLSTLQLDERVNELIGRDKVSTDITRTYLRANPHSRLRPVATQYNVEKPRVAKLTRNPTTLRIFGRDRLALWYAAANNDLSGSRGEAYGLWLLLKFWRQPRIQDLWAQYLDRPFTLPEDAR